MNKEIEPNKGKNKTYAVIAAIVVVLALFVIFKPNHNTKNTEMAKAPEVQTVEEKDSIARIDITTPLVNADEPQFEAYIEGNEEPLKQESWLPKYGSQGYIIQTDDTIKNIRLKALEDADIVVVLRGPWKQDTNKKMVEDWVKYTSLVINGNEILPEATDVWFYKPFSHIIEAKSGKEYKIHIEWEK